jgi:hypothetical protein
MAGRYSTRTLPLRATAANRQKSVARRRIIALWRLRLLQIAGTGIAGWSPAGIVQEGANHPLRRTVGRLAQAKLFKRTSTSRTSSYQGMPFRFGAFDDCSGKPPAICMRAMSRTPAHPPPIKAATTHQNETIWYPRFPWSRKLPGTDTAPWLRFAKKSGVRRTGFQAASAHRPTDRQQKSPLLY